jgi:hypothetical protein
MLDYEGEGYRLNKDAPIRKEREFLVDSENVHHEIWLNEVKLILAGKAANQQPITLLLCPYRAPEPKEIERGVKRLPPPVKYEII